MVGTGSLDPLPVGRSGADALDVARAAARRAAALLVAMRQDNAPVYIKGRGNLSTRADKEAEEAIISIIRREFPKHALVAEESGQQQSSSRYEWVIDPLDGSFNFSRGLPAYCVSIALADHGRPLVGVILDPNRDEIFQAVRGRGASVNGLAARVRPTRSLEAALIAFDLGYDNERALRAIELCQRLWGRYQAFRMMGSCALGLAYVASGRLDLYYHHSVYPWDYAAGWLLVREAGGYVTASDGSPMNLGAGSVLAANMRLHREFTQAGNPVASQ